MMKSTDLRRSDAFMAFWDALNEGRAFYGAPEVLYLNARTLWEDAMRPTPVEVKVDFDRKRVTAH